MDSFDPDPDPTFAEREDMARILHETHCGCPRFGSEEDDPAYWKMADALFDNGYRHKAIAEELSLRTARHEQIKADAAIARGTMTGRSLPKSKRYQGSAYSKNQRSLQISSEILKQLPKSVTDQHYLESQDRWENE